VAQAELSELEPLLVTVLKEGRLLAELPPLDALRARRVADVERLDPGVRRLVTPHIYHVSLSQRLWELKQRLIEAARGAV
jgi:nicotinate phosphoribosyltransferase